MLDSIYAVEQYVLTNLHIGPTADAPAGQYIQFGHIFSLCRYR